MNLLLALPTAGNPTDPFLASLQRITMPTTVIGFDKMTITGNFIPGQRELAARRATRTNADVLVMIDDDMIIPPYALVRMLDALSGDPTIAVVGALYYSRDGLRPIAADRWASNDTTTAAIPAFGNDLTYCDAVGFGCCAIRVSTLRNMPSPYFNTQVYVEERASRVRICNEDFLFCEEVRRGGWRVALDAGIRCKHYDRATDRSFPQDWEDPATTAVERMIVADSAQMYRLVPYDQLQPTTRERHELARVDYIITD